MVARLRALLASTMGLVAVGSAAGTVRGDTPVWIHSYWRRPWTGGLGGFGLTTPPDGALLGPSLFVDRSFGDETSRRDFLVRLEARYGWQSMAAAERPVDVGLSAGASEGCIRIALSPRRMEPDWYRQFKLMPCLALEAGVLAANDRRTAEPATRFLWLALEPKLRLQWLPYYAFENDDYDRREPPLLGWEIDAGVVLPMRRPVLFDASTAGGSLTRAWGVFVAARVVFVYYESTGSHVR